VEPHIGGDTPPCSLRHLTLFSRETKSRTMIAESHNFWQWYFVGGCSLLLVIFALSGEGGGGN